jgi:hypothetical protein
MFTYGNLVRGSNDLKNNLENFVGSLGLFINNRMWETGWWHEPSERIMYAPSLSDFITRKAPDGLGRSVEWVYASLFGPAKINAAARKTLEEFDRVIQVETGTSAEKIFKAEVIGSHRPAAAHGEIGNGRSRDNNVMSTIQGNDQTYTVRRLMRDAQLGKCDPELVELVRAGELSPNAAAIKAGFRRPTLTISDSPESAAASIRKKFGTDFARQLKELL